MLFWIVATLLTLMACLSVLVPFLRRPAAVGVMTSPDLAIYKDQLAEVERDLSRGLIGRGEAEQARSEIGRRILRASERAGGATVQRPLWGRAVTAAAVLSIPLVSWSVYAATGSPGEPAQPLQARLQESPGNLPVEDLIARAEAHLRTNPSDSRGWEVLAPIYLRVGRTDDAVRAYREAIDRLGSSGKRQSGLGEALIAQAGGTVTAEAREAFEQGLQVAPGDGKALFFLALAAAQEGDVAGAQAQWQALKADQPAGSPWSEAANQALARIAQPGRGPGAQDVQDAAALSPAERSTMIEGMVATLDAKLRDNPRDPEGWQKLVRSYAVLGRQDEAREALRRGMSALGETTRDAAALQDFARSINVLASVQP
jgi:cytochrome c-type biogenesis protein CcmH